MFRRDVLLRHNLAYNIESPYAEDYELWTRIGQCVQIANIPHVLAYYRVHPTSYAGRTSDRQRRARREVRILQAMNLGLLISAKERVLYTMLVEQTFTGSMQELRAVRRLLDEIYQVGLRRLGLPRHFVRRKLNQYWFVACYQSTPPGLAAIALYCSRPYGWAVNPRRVGAFVKRLYRHNLGT